MIPYKFENKTNYFFMINKLNEIKDTLDLCIHEENNLSLMGGKSGLALFYFYHYKYLNDQNSYNKGFELISNIFDSINSDSYHHSFCFGLSGIGWMIEHLEMHSFIECQTNEMLNEFDNYLYRIMIFEIQNKNFDYLHGALGFGLYFLSRMKKNTRVKNYLVKLVNELENKSELDNSGGLRWAPLKSDIIITKDEICNLSLSHGMASIVVILSKVYEIGILKEKTYRLLDGAINYILNNQLDLSIFYSSFPNVITATEKPINSRLAWCYGDLGIGIAIYQAGRLTGNRLWENKAVDILLQTTKRRNDHVTSVVDAGLCHGTAGIAHIYNRMYRYTKINTFKESAEYWFLRTLEMAKFEDGMAGYKAWRSIKNGGAQNDPGLLLGIAGIGLAIISYLSDIDPAWDECLLLS